MSRKTSRQSAPDKDTAPTQSAPVRGDGVIRIQDGHGTVFESRWTPTGVVVTKVPVPDPGVQFARDTSQQRGAPAQFYGKTALVFGFAGMSPIICDYLIEQGAKVSVVVVEDPHQALAAAISGCTVVRAEDAPKNADIIIDCRPPGEKTAARVSHDAKQPALGEATPTLPDPSNPLSRGTIIRDTLSDAAEKTLRRRALEPEIHPEAREILDLMEAHSLDAFEAIELHTELQRAKLAPETPDEVKERVQNKIPFEDALDVVVNTIAQDPSQMPVVKERLSGLFEQQAVAAETAANKPNKKPRKSKSATDNTFQLSESEQTRIAALWDVEVAKGTHNPDRRRPAQFIREELAKEIAAGMPRKELPDKLKQAYAGWLKNNRDAEPIWPEIDRTRPYTKIDELPTEEALQHLRAQELDQQARKRAKAKAKSL